MRITPSALSLVRLALAIAFPFVGMKWWLPVVVVAGASDWLDGHLARRWRVTNWTGGMLDGIADKAFVFSVLLTLAHHGDLERWMIPFLIARDLAVAGGLLIGLVRRNRQAMRDVESRLPGKVTTTMIFALFVALLAWPEAEMLHLVLFVLAAATNLAAAVDYSRARLRALVE